MGAEPSSLAPFISLGLGGVLGVGILGLLTFILTKTLPEERKAFLAHMDGARKEFLESVKVRDDRILAALEKHEAQVEKSNHVMASEIKDFSRAVRGLEKRE